MSTNARARTALLVTLQVLLVAPALCGQGAVLAVGATRPFATIQAAVNAANSGDLVAVDAGTYPSFTVNGKTLAVVANPAGGGTATYTVLGSPAIVVTGLQPDQYVTIANARATATTNGPAIVVHNATGAVRLLATTVLAGHFGAVPYDGLVEVRHTGSLWCDGLVAGDYRFRANGAGGTTGLAALFADSTPVHLARCTLFGLRSDNMAIDGGDALRCAGTTAVWGVDCRFTGGLQPNNALPGVHGGHAVHDASGTAGWIRLCACTLATADSTAARFAVAGVPAYLMYCPDDEIGRTELPAGITTLALGTTTSVTVSAVVPNRAFATLLDVQFGSSSVPVLRGDLLVGSGFAVLAAGLLGGPTAVPLRLPQHPGLVGLHGTVQSILLDTPPLPSFATTGAPFTIV